MFQPVSLTYTFLEQIESREGRKITAPANIMVQNRKRKSLDHTMPQLSLGMVGVNQNPVAGAHAPVFIVCLSDSSGSEIMDDYRAHDNEEGDTHSLVTKSATSRRSSFAQPDPFSAEESNYNLLAEERAQFSIVSFTTSDRSSATTDYGSFAVCRELPSNSLYRNSTSTRQ